MVAVLALLASVCTLSGPSAAKPLTEAEVREAIESSIRSLIGAQLSDKEFFLAVKVTLAQVKVSAPDESVSIPFAPIKVDSGYLNQLFRANNGVAPDIESLAINLVIDETIAPEKQELISGAIRDRFGIDNSTRILNVQRMKLVAVKQDPQDLLNAEKTKLESQRALLELQNQRTRFEMERREAELKARLAEMEAETRQKLDEAKKREELAKEELAKEKNAVSDVTPVQMAERFQTVISSVVAGLILIILAILGGGLVRKGLQPVATAIEKVGEGITSLTNQNNTTTIATDSAMDLNGSLAGGQAEVRSEAAEIALEKTVEEFVAGISEKIKVLAGQKNYSFYRHFCDLVDSPGTLKLAASVILCVDDESVQTILSGISSKQIERLKDYMKKPGTINEAQQLRRQALQEFYGRIAAEEFTKSPFYRMRGMQWLTTMDSAQIAQFAVSLEEKDRVILLACLTPGRVNMVISAASDEQDKLKLLDAIKQFDAVTEQQIATGLASLAEVAAKRNLSSETRDRSIVDPMEYLVLLAESDDAAAKKLLLDKINKEPDLAAKMRKYIIPFEAVANVPDEIVKEIFGNRPDLQIAKILFSASEQVVEKVYSVLPQIKKENVRSELDLLRENKIYAKRNQATSETMQSEISRYLIKLVNDGILEAEALNKDQAGTASRPALGIAS